MWPWPLKRPATGTRARRGERPTPTCAACAVSREEKMMKAEVNSMMRVEPVRKYRDHCGEIK